ncbi:hypothetical protein [Streptomyces gibsoniae]|uniref:Uncharacterized protein n=1 Tax=Streptomyces gibsoniae TaxID=3075529 RepID=A0ABU2TZL1_9ACTN|nr:hypothetical protein [Streptomyces sp. DSM 41699]MDT0466417.1 hypothetical protein [Streptomyces sp. DSM 41699]
MNSIARVTADDTDCVVAGPSKGTGSHAKGVAPVETAAQAAVSAFAGK